MKHKSNIAILVLVLFLVPIFTLAQDKLGDEPEDDLGNISDDYQEYFFEALKQKGIENYKRAIVALEKCLDIDDTKPVIYFELGKNYNTLNNFGAAEEALKKAISMQPDNEWFLDELYDVYYKQDDFDNAIKTVKQLVKYHPDYKMDLATIYIQKGKYNQALKVLDKLDQTLGTNEVRDQMRNTIYRESGDAGDRIDNLKERIAADPNNENNHLQLIYRYSQTGKTNKAFDAAKELLEIQPESKLVHLALYKFYLDDNEIEKAVLSMKLVLSTHEIDEEVKSKVLKDFLSFVEKNPKYQKDLIEATDNEGVEKNAKSLSNLGTYYLKTGDKQKALKNYKEALKQNPSDFKLLRDVILLHLELKQFKEALKQSEIALEFYPAQPILYLLNGVSNINLSVPKKAIDSLETGLDFLVENPTMERDFYMQLSEAYKLTDNNAKAKAFAIKSKAIKEQK